MYFTVQRVVALIAEATAPHRPGFDPSERLGNELRRLLAAIPPEDLPPSLSVALVSGEAVGPAAAQWLPQVQRWLADECARTALP